MRIFITHLSRVKYRTKRPPPPQRRITRIPTRPAANRGSGYNTPDLFWRKERKWLYLFLTQPWCWCWLPKKNMRYDKKSTFRYNKVNRCLARYSPRATTTDQPTNRAPNEPARPGPKWTKTPILSQIFTREIKSFVTHIMENPPRHLVHIVFGRSLDKMCKKWQYLAQNDQKCRFWTKFGRFWAKKPNFYGIK